MIINSQCQILEVGVKCSLCREYQIFFIYQIHLYNMVPNPCLKAVART